MGGRNTIEFDQRHVTRNQPITMLVLLSESLHNLLLSIYNLIKRKSIRELSRAFSRGYHTQMPFSLPEYKTYEIVKKS